MHPSQYRAPTAKVWTGVPQSSTYTRTRRAGILRGVDYVGARFLLCRKHVWPLHMGGKFSRVTYTGHTL